jgi:hypothetical protein
MTAGSPAETPRSAHRRPRPAAALRAWPPSPCAVAVLLAAAVPFAVFGLWVLVKVIIAFACLRGWL